ncbi:MAG: three-Cys-motif partner protein TcmP [Chloroflexota bacterium]|nr:three-Cys-motif partner protein TcmP [Chloroflexota bacterium]
MPTDHGVTWPAEPHTLAKIAILKNYLKAWFPICGQSARVQRLLYIDGFAGPGRYSNNVDGSPIAALNAAATALKTSGPKWIAENIHCVFIEVDQARADHLQSYLELRGDTPGLHIDVMPTTFIDGLARLKAQMPGSFQQRSPLFAFVDPFGATSVPFTAIADILGSPHSEVLVNFDADGIVRILRSRNTNSQSQLTTIFGDESWRFLPENGLSFRDQCLGVVELYKSRLRALPAVRYSYAFEMLTSRKSVGSVGYFLIFATQHWLGMSRMKEAMKGMARIPGSYQFSNANAGMLPLLRNDLPADHTPALLKRFVDRRNVSYDELRDFALNETPFVNPKEMLEILENENSLTVISSNPTRRKGTFNEKNISGINFANPEGD